MVKAVTMYTLNASHFLLPQDLITEIQNLLVVLLGFGFDASTDDYKVVTISCYSDNYEGHGDFSTMFVHVYMLKRNTWRSIKNCPYDCSASGGYHGPPVLLNGSLHWLATRFSEFDGFSDHEYVIVAFDLSAVEFSEVSVPSGVSSFECSCFNVMVLGGCICLNYTSGCGQNYVWVMKLYGVKESWTRIWIWSSYLHRLWPARFFEDGRILVNEGCTRFVLYDLEDFPSQDVAVLGMPSDFDPGLTFVESLVSPYSDNEMAAMQDNNSNGQDSDHVDLRKTPEIIDFNLKFRVQEDEDHTNCIKGTLTNEEC